MIAEKNKEDDAFQAGCFAGAFALAVIFAFGCAIGYSAGKSCEQHKANQSGVGHWKSAGRFGWGWDYDYSKPKE